MRLAQLKLRNKSLSFHGNHEIVWVTSNFCTVVYASNTSQRCEVHDCFELHRPLLVNKNVLLWAGLRVEAVKSLNA